jgi:hypothetical protein
VSKELGKLSRKYGWNVDGLGQVQAAAQQKKVSKGGYVE